MKRILDKLKACIKSRNKFLGKLFVKQRMWDEEDSACRTKPNFFRKFTNLKTNYKSRRHNIVYWKYIIHFVSLQTLKVLLCLEQLSFPPHSWPALCQVNLNKWGGAKTVWHYDSSHYDSLSALFKGILTLTKYHILLMFHIQTRLETLWLRIKVSLNCFWLN